MRNSFPAPTTSLFRLVLAFLFLVSCDDDEPVAPGDTTPPAAIFDLEVIAGAPGSLTLIWTAPGDDGSTGTAEAYDLRYSPSAITVAGWDAATSAEGEPLPRAAAQPETLRIDGLTPDAAYFIAIRSRDDSDNWSDLSNVVSAVASLNATAPAAITDLVATPSSMFSITLTWTAPGSDGLQGTAAEYDVRWDRRMITAENWQFALQLSGEPSPRPAGEPETVEARSLPNGTLYYFAVKTRDAGGLWSKISNIASSAPLPDTIPPNPVVDLAGTAASPTSIALSWRWPGDDGPIGAATRYELRYSTEAIDEEDWDSARLVDSLMAPAPSGSPATFLVRGLQNDSTYYFALRTEDDAGNWSALSNVPAIGPLIDDVPPAAITNLLWTALGGTSVRLEWSATGDDGCEGRASGYELRFSSSPITEASWDEATEVAVSLIPKACGVPETLVFEAPSDTAFLYVALRVRDDHDLRSGLSNPVVVDLATLQENTRWHTELGQLQFGEFGTAFQSIVGYEKGVVVGGQFNEIDGVEMRHVAYWDGARWLPTGSGLPLGGIDEYANWTYVNVSSISLYLGEVVIGGTIRIQSESPNFNAEVPIFRRWNGTEWQGLSAPSGPKFAYVDCVSASGASLYYAGFYSTYENVYDLEWEDVNYIERMTDSETIRLGEPNRFIRAIAEHQGAVIAGGGFTAIDGVPANRVAMWNGVSWSPMGGEMDGDVLALVSDGNRLVAGGAFTTAGGTVVNHVAEWDGSAWKALSDGLDASAQARVLDLEFHNGELYAAGNFSSDARNIRNIARWDGAAWRGLGSGTSRLVEDIVSHGGVLYAVGQFDSAGGQPTTGIAIWGEP